MGQATRQEIARVCHSGLDSSTLRSQVAERLLQAIPARAWCFATTDPATVLMTSSLAVGFPAEMEQRGPRFFEIEYGEDDFNKFSDLARRRPPVGILSEATQGDLTRSQRWRDVFGPLGLGDDLRASLVLDGSCWGYVSLHREQGQAHFGRREAEALEDVVTYLAEGLRTALLLENVILDTTDEGPGLVLLDEGLSMVAATPAAQRWMADIGQERPAANLPSAVYAVATHLRALEGSPMREVSMPRVRLRGISGRWLVIHASRFSGEAMSNAIAVILEPARPAEIASLIVTAYELTQRERDIAQLVFQGLSTAEIAGALVISANTVQDHLKAIFDKAGVRSRRELTARVFSDYYWPRVNSGCRVGVDGWFVELERPQVPKELP